MICYTILAIIILHTLYVYISNYTKDVTLKDQYPWNKIIQKKYYNEYYITLDVISYASINEWKNIIPGIELNHNVLMIPAVQEADALAITNLIISCCNNLLSFNDIINKDLIDLSIQKSRLYEFVRNKLKDQISNHSSDKRLTSMQPPINYETKELQDSVIKPDKILKTMEFEPSAYNSSGDLFEPL